MIYVGKTFGELELLGRIDDDIAAIGSAEFSAGYPYFALSDNVCLALQKRGIYDLVTRYSIEPFTDKKGVQKIGRSKITLVKNKAKTVKK